jgi:Leucine-rich repeat (LRR) protein
MKYLVSLHLSNNRFRSHDDNNLEPFFAALSNCTNLQDAGGTGDELPSWLRSMLSSLHLPQIVLSNNALMGEIPPSIGNSTNLGVLDLSGNMLSGSIPSSIESLAELRVLSLQRNRLSGQVPVASLGRCTKLIRVDLSSNRFNGTLH